MAKQAPRPLKRHPALVSLSRQHQRGLFAANLVRSSAPRYPGLPHDLEGKRAYLVDYYHQQWLPHVACEEEVLFPGLRGLSERVDELLEELHGEHQALERAFEELPAAGEPDLQAHLDQITQLLRQHIRKEERQLFELVQAQMEESDLLTLGERIDQYLR